MFRLLWVLKSGAPNPSSADVLTEFAASYARCSPAEIGAINSSTTSLPGVVASVPDNASVVAVPKYKAAASAGSTPAIIASVYCCMPSVLGADMSKLDNVSMVVPPSSEALAWAGIKPSRIELAYSFDWLDASPPISIPLIGAIVSSAITPPPLRAPEPPDDSFSLYSLNFSSATSPTLNASRNLSVTVFPRLSAADPIPGIHDRKSLVMSISASKTISITDSSNPITALPNTGP